MPPNTHDRLGTQSLQNQDVQATAGFSENLNVPSMKDAIWWKHSFQEPKHKNRQAGNVAAQGNHYCLNEGNLQKLHTSAPTPSHLWMTFKFMNVA